MQVIEYSTSRVFKAVYFKTDTKMLASHRAS